MCKYENINIKVRFSSILYYVCGDTTSCSTRQAAAFFDCSRHSGAESISLTPLFLSHSISTLSTSISVSAISSLTIVSSAVILSQYCESSTANFFMITYGLFQVHLFDSTLLRSSQLLQCYYFALSSLSFCPIQSSSPSILFCFVLLYIAHDFFSISFNFQAISMIIFCILISVLTIAL